MSNKDVWAKYPVLQQGFVVHLNPEGGTLFSDTGSSNLTPAQAAFLQACDGTNRIQDLVPRTWDEAYGDFKYLIFISGLLNSGRLELVDEPGYRPPAVTGSSEYFFPPHMSVELTAGCNLKCRHCYRDSDLTKHQHMATDDLIDILQRLHGIGLRSVELTGGEPFLHENLADILAFCADKFDLVAVLINGTILSQEICDQFESMGDQLLLSVSLDGSTAAIHNQRRGSPTAFQRTVANLARLTELGIRVRVAMCVDEESFADVENTLLLARELGAFAFSYSPVLPLGRGKEWAAPGWKLDGRRVAQTELELTERYKDFLSTLSEDALCELESGDNCGAGHRIYTMDPFGRIRPCTMFEPEALVVGDLGHQGPEEVFGHPVIHAMAQLTGPNADTCGDCRLALYCRHCSLRGFQGSQMVKDCRWIHLPTVQQVAQHLQLDSMQQNPALGLV